MTVYGVVYAGDGPPITMPVMYTKHADAQSHADELNSGEKRRDRHWAPEEFVVI